MKKVISRVNMEAMKTLLKFLIENGNHLSSRYGTWMTAQGGEQYIYVKNDIDVDLILNHFSLPDDSKNGTIDVSSTCINASGGDLWSAQIFSESILAK